MTRGRRRPPLALLVLVLPPLLLFACRSAPPPGPDTRPLGELLAIDDPRPQRFLDALLEAGRERHGLRGIADLALDGPDGSARLKQVVLLERPARLRVEVLGFLNQTAAVLTTDGERFRLLRSDRSSEEGLVRPSLLWEVAGIALRPDAAVRVLLGTPGLPDGARPLPPRATPGGGVRLAYAHERAVAALEFDATGALERWRIEELGGRHVLLEAHYTAYAALAGSGFAHQIELSDHRNGTTARVHFAEVELNPTFPPGIFALDAGGPR